jgi:carbohydrate-selective porin OprB
MENKIKTACLLLGALILISSSASGANVTTALSSINGQYSIVWAYNASDTADHWKKFVPGAAVGNDLSDMGVSWGYWVRVNATSATLNISGTAPTSTDIPMVEGWNLVGYPSTTAQTVTSGLSSISGKYSIVWGYNASDTSDTWKKFVPGAAVGNDLQALTPGFGYWIRLNATSATLTI